MNRDVDYRTDLYSLGVVFYKLLTGVLPFGDEAQNSLDLIHSHIARVCQTPHELSNKIPTYISDVVMHCLEKDADARYQSCYGLRQDIELCMQMLSNNDTGQNFVAGKNDICSVFNVSQRLFGREKEIKLLLRNFDRVANGEIPSMLMLVSGYSGIGK
jgi:histidine kinase